MTVQWVTDDKVSITNGTTSGTYSVTVSGEQAYITNAITGDIRGYYPSDILVTDNASTPTVRVQGEDYGMGCYYNSYFLGDGRQYIPLPMVAIADSGATEIQFKNITAAVRVLIRNEKDYDIELEQVIVKSNGSKLYGDVNLNLNSSDLGITAQASNPETNDSTVTIQFPNGNYPVIPVWSNNDDNICEVQVPILPVNKDHTITIQIKGHKVGDQYTRHTFNHTDTIPSNLGRNKMLTARCRFY